MSKEKKLEVSLSITLESFKDKETQQNIDWYKCVAILPSGADVPIKLSSDYAGLIYKGYLK